MDIRSMACGTKHRTDTSSGSDPTSSDLELSSHDEDDIYEVERILAQQEVQGETFYLVKWLNYGDARCTWEPKESFSNEESIVEWEKQLEAGDALDEEQVAAVQARMDADQRKRYEIRERKERKRLLNTNSELKAGHQTQTRTQLRDTQEHKVGPQPNMDSQQGQISKPSTPVRDLKRDGTKRPRGFGPTDGQPTKFHGIASPSYTRRASPPKPRKSSRSEPVGTRFKNLQHMNSAQKEARTETVGVANGQIKPVTDWAETMPREPAHHLPSARPQDEREDSPLFFPETSAQDQQGTAESTVSLEDPNDTPLFSSMGNRSSLLARESGLPEPSKPLVQAPIPTTTQPAQSWNPELSIPQRDQDLAPRFRTPTGRSFGPDEILIKLYVGQHEVGDVLLLQFPPWMKSILVNLKQGHLLPIRFDQSLVLNHEDFAAISSRWPPEVAARASVQPFSDTEAAVLSLASYLEEHDLLAVWEHPNADNTIGLVLYSPRSKSWRQPGQGNRLQAPLILDARNRAWRGNKPDPIRPQPTAIVESRGESPRPQYRTFSERSVSHTAVPSSQHLTSGANHALFSEALVATPSHADDARKSHKTTLPAHANTPQFESLKAGMDAETPLQNVDATITQMAPPGSELDWSVRADFRLLTSKGTNQSTSGKAFVYIAFAERYPPQAKALKKWAGRYTSPRFVYTDEDGPNGWDDIESGNNAALLLFHEDEPSFSALKDMFLLLGRPNVACYNVVWSEPSRTQPAEYIFNRIFPRGTVLLLPEWTMVKLPRESIFALEWFEKESKGKGYKVMVRPNVRAWLLQKAVECEEKEDAEAMFEILRLLFKLSPFPDVTVSNEKDDLELLGLSIDDKDNFIVPLPTIPDYDISQLADGSLEQISKRDDLLLGYFVHWSVTNACKYRRFIALEDVQGRKVKPEGAEHIMFYQPEKFVRDERRKIAA